MNRHIQKTTVLIAVCAALILIGCNDDSKQPDPQNNQQQAAATTTTQKPVNKTWSIKVGGEERKTVQGLDIITEFHLNLIKKGGADASGLYKGKATASTKADFSKLPESMRSIMKTSGSASGTASDNSVIMTVHEPAELAPLVPTKETSTTEKNEDASDYESSGNFVFTGTGTLDINVAGPQGETGKYNKTEKATDKVPYNMSIKGDEVEIRMPKAGTFRGIIESY